MGINCDRVVGLELGKCRANHIFKFHCMMNDLSALYTYGFVETPIIPNIVRQPSPPLVLAPIQPLPAGLGALTHVLI